MKTESVFDSPPHAKGDRVVIDYPDTITHPGYDGVHGRVLSVKHKQRPRYGKTPGWWVDVLLDPEKGIKRWTLEVHANHVRKEEN